MYGWVWFWWFGDCVEFGFNFVLMYLLNDPRDVFAFFLGNDYPARVASSVTEHLCPRAPD